MAEFPTLIIRKFSDIADAFRTIQLHLGLSNEAVTQISGMCDGFVDKVIGRTRSKRISEVSFDLLMGALAIQFRVEVDPDQARRVARRHAREHRDLAHVRTSQPLSRELLARAAAELGRRGALAAAKARRAHNGHATGHATNGRGNGYAAVK